MIEKVESKRAPTALAVNTQGDAVKFVVLGDYGAASKGSSDASNEQEVASLVQGWMAAGAAFVLTVGDNNYGSLDTGGFDTNVGAYYCNLLNPYLGALQTTLAGVACGATANKFFPTPGNHDWSSSNGYSPYNSYFPWAQSKAGQYYDFPVMQGDVELLHVFAINSNCSATDSGGSNHGCPRQSDQCAQQYADQKNAMLDALKNSNALWNIAFFHHPPYSMAGEEGCSTMAGFDFDSPAWQNQAGRGFAAIFSGHAHLYQRIITTDAPNLPYFVNGYGGNGKDDCDHCSLATSAVQQGLCYDNHHGAQRVTATATELTIEFVNKNGTVEDTCVVTSPGPNPQLTCTSKQSLCVDRGQ
jgi:hypothetical protein